MIDPLVSLAFSIHSAKGVYALLLGSGVSRSAGIPTGWEVVLDLTRKLARIRGEDCEPDPEAWYRKTFSQEPDYSLLLDGIAKTGAERQQLLKSYFEPNEEERQQGVKMPTAAHKTIAELAGSGHIRVIVTTNFDRLLEKAMEAAGINPSVISTADAANGALPLVHSQCTIIKVHGDYLDTRIKNTAAELGLYDAVLDNLLDRIFDEFGLIVCGWSGEWDTALRGALERCKSRRFTTYWTLRKEPSESAKRIIDFRQAAVVSIKDADGFFADVASKVKTLDEVARPHPLSAKMAVGALKRYLTLEQKIPIHDLVMAEVDKVYAEIPSANFPVHGNNLTKDDLINRLRRYEAMIETLQALLINGCYWGGDDYCDIWSKAIQRVGSPAGEWSGLTLPLQARLYPALLLLYSAGMSAIAAGKYATLRSLLENTKARRGIEEKVAVLAFNPFEVIDENWAQSLYSQRRKTPVSDIIYESLRKPFAELLPDNAEYQRAFDRYEYLFALVYIDVSKQTWAPVGRFVWNLHSDSGVYVPNEIEAEIKEKGANWSPLKAGLFGGDPERVKAARTKLSDLIARLGLGW